MYSCFLCVYVFVYGIISLLSKEMQKKKIIFFIQILSNVTNFLIKIRDVTCLNINNYIHVTYCSTIPCSPN